MPIIDLSITQTDIAPNTDKVIQSDSVAHAITVAVQTAKHIRKIETIFGKYFIIA